MQRVLHEGASSRVDRRLGSPFGRATARSIEVIVRGAPPEFRASSFPHMEFGMSHAIDLALLAQAVTIKAPMKVPVGEGHLFSGLGLSFRWKVRGRDTDYAFAVYEMTMSTGSAIPMHLHPFAEFFYVLEGAVEVVTASASGEKVIVGLAANESASVPSGTPHGLRNASGSTARFLSVANFAHEEAFNRIERAMEEAGGESLSDEEQAMLFLRVAAESQTQFMKQD